MRTKIYLLLWLFTIVPLAFVSCNDDDDMEEATLEVSANDVNFTKAGGEQTVTITTNQEKWIASSPLESSWLTLTQNGDQLILKADPNNAGTDQKGYVLINAGGASAKISVMQSAGDVILNLSMETVNIAKKGGEQRIDIVSNQNFKVEVDDAAKTWLSTNYMEGSNYFTLSVGVYKEIGTRTGKIYVTAGTVIKEVTVAQKGNDLILLPLIAKETTINEIVTFETERGSVMTQLPDGLFNQDTYMFGTDNKDFPQVLYQMTTKNYSVAATATTNKDLFNDAATVDEYMKAAGFEVTTSGSQYTHPEFPYTISITETKEKDGYIIQSTYVPKQNKDYPTFTVLPMKVQMDWTGFVDLDLKGKSIAEVKEAEAGLGGTLNAELTDEASYFYWFDSSKKDHDDNSIVGRAYWFNTTEEVAADSPHFGLLHSARALYDKIELAFWTDEGSGLSYLTKEFSKLLADEGFTYLMTNSRGYIYYVKTNDNGTLDALAFNAVQFSDFMPDTRLVDFQTFKDAADAGSAVSLLMNKDKYIGFAKKMQKTFQKLEKRQTLK